MQESPRALDHPWVPPASNPSLPPSPNISFCTPSIHHSAGAKSFSFLFSFFSLPFDLQKVKRSPDAPFPPLPFPFPAGFLLRRLGNAPRLRLWPRQSIPPPFHSIRALYKEKNKCERRAAVPRRSASVRACVRVVGGRRLGFRLVALECALVCGESDKS